MTAKNTRKGKTPAATVELAADLSPAVRALETAYRMIQRRHPEVPDVTIVVKRDGRAWGHTTVARIWSPAKGEEADRLEIMVSGENLARGAREVAATLIHEAAHARDLALGILDTDVNGRHNAKFRASAEALGLTCGKHAGHEWMGYSATSLTDEQAEHWRHLIACIERGLAKAAKAHRSGSLAVDPGTGSTTVTVGPTGGIIGPRRRGGNRNLLKAVCGCGHSIRLSQTVLDTAEPTCQVCSEPFAVAA